MRTLIAVLLVLCAMSARAQAPSFTGSKLTGPAPLSTVLTWNVPGAAACTAGGAGGVAAWSGSVPITGTRTLSGIAVDYHLTLTCMFASAPGSITLIWVPPTTNTDGSALTDLGGYRILYGTAADSLTRTIDLQVPGANTYRVDALTPATWFFAMTSRTLTCWQTAPATCRESAPSNTISKAVAGTAPPPVALAVDIDVYTVPAPPTGLTAVDAIAYEIRPDSAGQLVAQRIGIVRRGTLCASEAQQVVAGVTYSRIDRDAVDVVNFANGPDAWAPILYARC